MDLIKWLTFERNNAIMRRDHAAIKLYDEALRTLAFLRVVTQEELGSVVATWEKNHRIWGEIIQRAHELYPGMEGEDKLDS